MPGYVYASHHFQGHGTVIVEGKKTWKRERKTKRKSNKNHYAGQSMEIEIRNSMPDHCGMSKSLVKFVLFLQWPLDLEQQGIEFGPVG
jgi:hypothetical protein